MLDEARKEWDHAIPVGWFLGALCWQLSSGEEKDNGNVFQRRSWFSPLCWDMELENNPSAPTADKELCPKLHLSRECESCRRIWDLGLYGEAAEACLALGLYSLVVSHGGNHMDMET